MRVTSLSLVASVLASVSLLACGVDDAKLGKGASNVGKDDSKTQAEAAGGSKANDPRSNPGKGTGGSKGDPTDTGAGGASQACTSDKECSDGLVCIDQVCQSETSTGAGGTSSAAGGHTAEGGHSGTPGTGGKAAGGAATGGNTSTGGSKAEGGTTGTGAGGKAEGGNTSTGAGGATQLCTKSEQCQAGFWCLYGACVPFEGEEGGTDGSGGETGGTSGEEGGTTGDSETGAGGASQACQVDKDCGAKQVCFGKVCVDVSG